MKKVLIVFIPILVIFLFNPSHILAQTREVGVSAIPKYKLNYNHQTFDYRHFVLQKFLYKHKSPLAPYASHFVDTADFYGIDWRMVPAISGVESTFGKRIPFNSYNAYGWANGNFAFKSWPDSITIVTRTLRTKYVNRGAVSVSKIAVIYAPPSKTWGQNVNFFIRKISILPLSFDI